MTQYDFNLTNVKSIPELTNMQKNADRIKEYLRLRDAAISNAAEDSYWQSQGQVNNVFNTNKRNVKTINYYNDNIRKIEKSYGPKGNEAIREIMKVEKPSPNTYYQTGAYEESASTYRQKLYDIYENYRPKNRINISQKGYIQPGQVAGSAFRTASKILQESAGPLGALDVIQTLSNAPSSNQSQGMTEGQEQAAKEAEINSMYIDAARKYILANEGPQNLKPDRIFMISQQLRSQYENQPRSEPQFKAR